MGGGFLYLYPKYTVNVNHCKQRTYARPGAEFSRKFKLHKDLRQKNYRHSDQRTIYYRVRAVSVVTIRI